MFFIIVMIIIIIGLLLFYQSQSLAKIEPFLGNLQIDNVKYGHLNQIDHDFSKNHQIQLFPLPLPLQDIKHPYLNSSLETAKEIEFVLEMTKNATNKQKVVIDKYEKNVLDEFLIFCQNNKLYFDAKYLQQLTDDVKTLCYRLKLLYGRPRPSQLAYYLGQPLRSQPIVTSQTPSYPSYSTLLSKTLANVLSYNNPRFAKDLQTIAKEVELSRLSGGFNYPSDNKVSLQIAEILKKYIKYFEI